MKEHIIKFPESLKDEKAFQDSMIIGFYRNGSCHEQCLSLLYEFYGLKGLSAEKIAAIGRYLDTSYKRPLDGNLEKMEVEKKLINNFKEPLNATLPVQFEIKNFADGASAAAKLKERIFNDIPTLIAVNDYDLPFLGGSSPGGYFNFYHTLIVIGINETNNTFIIRDPIFCNEEYLTADILFKAWSNNDGIYSTMNAPYTFFDFRTDENGLASFDLQKTLYSVLYQNILIYQNEQEEVRDGYKTTYGINGLVKMVAEILNTGGLSLKKYQELQFIFYHWIRVARYRLYKFLSGSEFSDFPNSYFYSFRIYEYFDLWSACLRKMKLYIERENVSKLLIVIQEMGEILDLEFAEIKKLEADYDAHARDLFCGF
ncbi:MAG TPA: BtrH N-terminal domain-containing protein [Bacillota bacterium]|nr:BtrH N-terminal domain-containing protein [Bacillota bacterium]